ncbi:MAG: DNA-processing protein DprA [Bacteroidales bacterium]|nr:DNA-processing protein DprA [Bacteroidales bacterium]MCL2739189.1 DNA-processing protein DprA [Bacteroidales bacterium]
MSGDELLYLTALNLTLRYRGGAARALVEHFGTASEIFRQTAAALSKTTGMTMDITTKLLSKQNLQAAEAEINWTHQQGIRTYTVCDPSYPKRLFHCPDAPVILYQSGPANLSPPKALAVVGTRSATPYGLHTTGQIIKNLAARGHDCAIISGLAYGIDIAAHRAALDAGLPTIAVFAFGLDHIQPAQHLATAKKIMEQGACVSDFPTKTMITKANFLKRNRIIAGLADGVLVIESKEKGGALITAEIAQSYDREVMAVPGRWGDLCSQGCNSLIREQKAALVNKVEDIEQQLGWTPSKTEVPAAFMQERDLIDAGLLQALEQGPCSMDQLYRMSRIPLPELSARLMRLAIKGSIKRIHQNQYCLSC